ncbi:chymotrypsin-like elastase family member 2A [Anopheles ziemanni]|uniref:chymotrypsin-like elastase family member 2A n=1 Tax=Anopheles coustani TaxID=139045 RepID=UPI0026594BE1|nr:chymotrypsin-like elastase family member 2A [Anopheles coustani]XP_058169555.1 chymotrypsin-like elastase family member 2A [Anopheles ziemanni]
MSEQNFYRESLIIVVLLSVLTVCISGKHVQQICGQRKLVDEKIEPLIINGVNSTAGHWPWHAALYHLLGNATVYACGGTIVSANSILTAGHCLFYVGLLRADQMIVHVGRNHLDESGEHIQVMQVSNVVLHPTFTRSSMANDIAILRLASDIVLTEFVQIACIWSESDPMKKRIIGKNGTIVGFGSTANEGEPPFLREATLTVVDGYRCVESDPTYGSVLKHTMYCAGRDGLGISACNGDSGGDGSDKDFQIDRVGYDVF